MGGTPQTPPRRGRLLASLPAFVPVAALLLVVLPLTTWATWRSFGWIGETFPGFLLMDNAVIPSMSGVDWPDDKGALFHAQVTAFDGRAVSSSAPIYAAVAHLEPGTAVNYQFRKEGRSFERTVATRRFTAIDYYQVYGIVLSIAWTSLAVGLLVGFMRPGTRQSLVYQAVMGVGSIFSATAVFLHLPDHPLLTTVYFIAESFFPAVWIHLALVFPVDRRFTGVWRLATVAPYVVATVLSVEKLRGFHRQPPDLGSLHVGYLFLAVSFLTVLGSFFYTYWENREPMARLRVKALLPSAAIMGVACTFGFVNNAFAGGDFPMQIGVIVAPLFYASVAYAIVKHDLFDIDRVVRQSFVYALVSITVVAAYGIVVAVPTRFLVLPGEAPALIGLLFILIFAFALDPLRRTVQRFVDRAFYRTRLDYRATIGELSEILTSFLDGREIADQVTRVVSDAMHLESATVYLRASADGMPAVRWARKGMVLAELGGDDTHEAVAAAFEGDHRDVLLSETLDGGPTTAREDASARPAGRELARLGSVLALPLSLRGTPIGFLALGKRRSGQPFSSDDVELLRTLANQTAIALQNARSYQALQDLTRNLDEKVQLQTEELRISNQELGRAYDDLKSAQAQLVQSEKMASLGQLVAGVAHELNNPASFVHGGLANLAEYLDRFVRLIRLYEAAPIADAEIAQTIARARVELRLDEIVHNTPELLQICSEGSERIKKIVDDLRLFARADRGERLPTDLADDLESTLRLLGDRLVRGGIRIRRDFQPVPRVEANVGQLNQVWMNLIGNAIDALDGRTDAEIALAVRPAQSPTGDADGNDRRDWVAVEVHDNGSGIRGEDLGRIFEPFFSTKPIGRGTGLGLSIAYGAVKSHGGTIRVDSAPGAGTSVTVLVPASVGA